jgi:DNA-directed RNA polymerase specialized sigma24 family protein
MATANVQDLNSTASGEFEQLFRERSRMVYLTAYGVTGSWEDSQDVLQTLFLRLWRQEFQKTFIRIRKA